jgi:hypothetical protein
MPRVVVQPLCLSLLASLVALPVAVAQPARQPLPQAIARPTLDAPTDDAEKNAAITALPRVDAPPPQGLGPALATASASMPVPVPMLVFPNASHYAAGPPIIRADSGRELQATHLLVRARSPQIAGLAPNLAPTLAPSSSPSAVLNQWLRPAPSLEVRDVLATDTTQTLQPLVDEGWTLVALVQQPSRREGSTLVIGPQRAGVRWLPELDAATLQSLVTPATPPIDDALRARLLADPSEHWRLWLLTGEVQSLASLDATTSRPASELSPSELRPSSQSQNGQSQNGRALQLALAQRDLARAASMLIMLQQQDKPLAQRVVRRLTLRVPVGDGLLMPAWPTAESLAALWEDAANTAASPARRAERIARWLEEQPTGAAWVQHDARTITRPRDASAPSVQATSFASILRLINLDDTPQVAWLRLPTPSRTSTDTSSLDLQPLAPGTFRELVVPHLSTIAVDGRSNEQASTQANAASLGLGTWSFSTPLLLSAAPALPPQLALGTLRTDLSLPRWLAGNTSLDTGLSLRLLRIASEDAHAWWLTIDVPSAQPSPAELPAQPEAAAWRVRIDLGPNRTRIDVQSNMPLPEGVVLAPNPASAGASGPDAQSPPATLWVRLPQDQTTTRPFETSQAGVIQTGISQTGISQTSTPDLLLGLTLDANGSRASWPRALVPWQAEPSQARIDLRAWDVQPR